MLLLPAWTALSVWLVAQDLYDLTQVRDLYFTFKQANWKAELFNTLNTRQDIKADLKVDAITLPDVGIRIKGNTSSRVQGDKKPFNVSIDAFNPAQRLYGFQTINLNNGYVDPTFTRETLTFTLFRDYLPTPRFTYVRVHLNNTYWGLYIMVEQINKDMLRTWFDDEDGTRYKGDPPSGAMLNSATLEYRGSSPANYYNSYEIKTPTHPNAWIDLVTCIDKLNNTTVNFKDVIQKHVNVDRALWYIAACDVIHNMDSYAGGGHNYYIYFDPVDGRLNMLPWDANMSFASFQGGSSPHTLSPWYQSTSSRRPLISKLFGVPEFREIYLAHIRTILDEWYAWDTKLGVVNKQYQDLIRTAVQSDPNRLYSYTDFDRNVTQDVNLGGFNTSRGLKPLTDNRRAYLTAHPDIAKPTPTLADVRYWPSDPRPNEEVWVTVRAGGPVAIQSVSLRTAVAGAFADNPMFDDGQHNDGQAADGVYGGSFRAGAVGDTTRFYVLATNTAGTVRLAPRRAEHETLRVRAVGGPPSGPIVINEVLADNDTGDRDEQGEFEDWIELYNRGAQRYDLSGHYLSDNLSNKTKWKFPTGTAIPAGGYLRVWADDEPGEGPLHATFKLDADGEEVALFDTDARANALLDAVIFGDQRGDRSFGRVPDGGPNLFFLWTPTGGAPLTGTGTSSLNFARYDARQSGSPNDLKLRGSGVAKVGGQFQLKISGGSPSGSVFLGIAFGAAALDLGGIGTLAINPAGLILLPLPLDPAGEATLTLTAPSVLGGITFYLQALEKDLSNALALRIAP